MFNFFSVPGSAPTSVNVIRKTFNMINLHWTALDSTDADGYVIYVTNDTDTVQRVQVEGSSNNVFAVTGLKGGTTYSITVRAYQQLVGPPSNTITVQTLPSIATMPFNIFYYINFIFLVILVSSIIHLSTSIHCLTPSFIDPLTDVSWLVNGMMKNNTLYTLTDSLTYNNTLLVYPDPLEETINVTCTAMIGGINYSQLVMLHRMIKIYSTIHLIIFF